MTANPFVMHEQPPISVGMSRCLRGVLGFLLFQSLLTSSVVLADSYSSLPDTDKAYVKRVCAPIQYQLDATAYRNCVDEHSSAIRESNRTPVASLNFGEQLSVQQACQTRGTIGSINYRQCVITEARSLEGIQTANLSSLSAEEIYAARQNCADTKGGVKAYRQCMNAAATGLQTPVISKVELAALAVPELENKVTANYPETNELALDAHNRLSLEVASDKLQNTASQTTTIPVTPVALRIDTLPLTLPAEDSTATNSQSTDPDSQEPADATDLDPIESNKPPLEVAKDLAQKLWAQLLASLEGVTGMDRIILLAALALPFVLIGFWLLMRRSSSKSESYRQTEPYRQPDSRMQTDQIDTRENHSMNDGDGLSMQQHHYADQVDDLFIDDDDLVFADEDSPKSADINSTIQELEIALDTVKPVLSNNLRALLGNREREQQLGLVIEFMIYWMAFTDERYEPELKVRIFAEEEPDDHDLIKRWVLSHDYGAFADATSWLQNNATIEEREQILKLLMALLVYEEGITPVQNTMLRFLSNAFGLTHIQLDELFQTAFGHALPSMPRPDKPTWWNRQSSDKLKRWDARSVAQQSQNIQARVKLGLPLSGELDQQQIIERRERAISRCQVANFDRLTNREQQLAESQQAKYNNAAEVLMEISE